MKRRRIYTALILGLLFLRAAGSADLITAERVDRAKPMEARRAEWQRMAADDLNGRGTSLKVDGRTVEGVSPRLTDKLELMLPADALPESFGCAAGRYDGSRLVVERNSAAMTMKAGEPSMDVNGISMKLSESFREMDGRYYVPVEAVTKGLSYAAFWSPDSGVLSMEDKSRTGNSLPGAYDYREKGRAPAVKNQGALGTCWSFASLAALESSLLPEESWEFSEDHMSLSNSFGMGQNDGGEYTMSMAYLLAWQGPVAEADDPYGDGVSPQNLEARKHVQEIQILPSKNYEAIKRAVYCTGGVQSSLYTSLKNEHSRSVYFNRNTSAYCYIGTEKPNHDVVIVGWDDNYPKENFNMDLEGDGAFICVNSWGTAFGDGGYFYVSYYDTNIGIHNILYTGVEETDNYDRIYQSDLCGWVGQLGYNRETAYFANVFTAGGRESLDAVGFYATGPNTEYEVYVAENLSETPDFQGKTPAASGRFENGGYYTVKLAEPPGLSAGERFAVIVKITTPGGARPVAIEYSAEDKKAAVDISDGEGYISHGGTVWERVEEQYGCNVCLKAYTSRLP